MVHDLEIDILETILDYFNMIKVQWNLAGDYHGSNPDFIKDLRGQKEATDKHLEESEIEATAVPPSLTREKSVKLLKEKEQAVNHAVM
jgi:hypothetical protein